MNSMIWTPPWLSGFIVPFTSVFTSSHAHHDIVDTSRSINQTSVRHARPGRFVDPLCTSSVALLITVGAIGNTCQVIHAIIAVVLQLISNGKCCVTPGYSPGIIAATLVAPMYIIDSLHIARVPLEFRIVHQITFCTAFLFTNTIPSMAILSRWPSLFTITDVIISAPIVVCVLMITSFWMFLNHNLVVCDSTGSR